MIKICYLGDDGQRHVNWRQKEGIVSVPQVYYLGNTAYFPIYSRFYYVLLLRTFCVLVGGGGSWSRLVLTGPRHSVLGYFYTVVCAQGQEGEKFPSSHSLPFLLQPKVLFSPPGQTYPTPTSLAAHPLPQRPRHPAPQPRLVPLLETGSRKSKGFNSFSTASRLSLTPWWPAPVINLGAAQTGPEARN